LLALATAAMSHESTTLEVRDQRDTLGVQSKRISRCARQWAKIASGSTSTGKRQLVAMNGSRAWVIDETNRTGRYVEDARESSEVHLPIFTDSALSASRNYIEWGQELSFLKKTPATALHRIEKAGITYLFAADSLPRNLVVLRGKDTLARYVYVSYKTESVCSPADYVPDADVDFSKAALEDLQSIFKDWTRPAHLKRIPSCKPIGVVARLNLLHKSIKPSNQLPFIGFLAGMNEKMRESERLATFSFAIREPVATGAELFRKSIRLNVDSLRKTKLSSPGQVDFFWGHYYATRNVADLQFLASAFTKGDTGFAPSASKEFIVAAKRAATSSMQSHLATLDYFREDLTKAGNAVLDTTTHLFTTWLLQQQKNPR
jgi:hypothetical protein